MGCVGPLASKQAGHCGDGMAWHESYFHSNISNLMETNKQIYDE